jgi:trimethylamine---corrinoid protein Co-methyltransferase
MIIRPKLQLLEEAQIRQIIQDAYNILDDVGVMFKDNSQCLDLFEGAGARVDRATGKVKLSGDIIDRALRTVPPVIPYYDKDHQKKLFNLGGDDCHITGDGVALYIQDYENPKVKRAPVTRDQVIHSRLHEECKHIAFTAPFLLTDVPREIADNYRFLLDYLYCSHPTYCSAWSKEGFDVMDEMIKIMGDGVPDLSTKPAHVHPNDPSSPLHWSPVVIQNFIDCLRTNLPAVVLPIPLAGATSPVTITGTAVQTTAENLSGVVLSQLVRKEGFLIWGSGASAFDMRTGTAIQSAMESIMMMCLIAQVGNYLKIPTLGNLGRTDSKLPDEQGSFETANAYLLGYLCRVNMMRGAGILEYASVISHEKLMIDNEIAGQAQRLVNGGIEFNDESRAVDLIKEMFTQGKSYLRAKHTLANFRKEFVMPGPIIDRGTRTAFEEAGFKSALQKAHDLWKKIIAEKPPREIDQKKKRALIQVVKARAKKYGVDRLPIETAAA